MGLEGCRGEGTGGLGKEGCRGEGIEALVREVVGERTARLGRFREVRRGRDKGYKGEQVSEDV